MWIWWLFVSPDVDVWLEMLLLWKTMRYVEECVNNRVYNTIMCLSKDRLRIDVICLLDGRLNVLWELWMKMNEHMWGWWNDLIDWMRMSDGSGEAMDYLRMNYVIVNDQVIEYWTRWSNEWMMMMDRMKWMICWYRKECSWFRWWIESW